MDDARKVVVDAAGQCLGCGLWHRERLVVPVDDLRQTVPAVGGTHMYWCQRPPVQLRVMAAWNPAGENVLEDFVVAS